MHVTICAKQLSIHTVHFSGITLLILLFFIASMNLVQTKQVCNSI